MLQEIKTKFGSIYIEQLGEQRDKERLDIYDSNKKYMTYIDGTVFEEVAKNSETTTESVYHDWCESFNKYQSIEELVDILGLETDIDTTDWKEAAEFFFNPNENPEYEEHSEQELLENEWVNKIGNYYIVISEWR